MVNLQTQLVFQYASLALLGNMLNYQKLLHVNFVLLERSNTFIFLYILLAFPLEVHLLFALSAWLGNIQLFLVLHLALLVLLVSIKMLQLVAPVYIVQLERILNYQFKLCALIVKKGLFLHL